MNIKTIFLFVIWFLIIIKMCILAKTEFVHDLSINRKFTIFEIYNINKFKNHISTYNSVIHIDDTLPENISIHKFPVKGWGLISNKSFKKNEIIYKAEILKYPEKGILVKSKLHGVKRINKEIHCGDLSKKYNLLSVYDCFLNHLTLHFL